MGSPEISVVLVHYRAAALAAEAVAALRRDLGESNRTVEIALVDNGSDAAERALLGSLPVRLIEPGCNLGYAGGLNRGIRDTRGPFLLLANPDVLVQPGCCRRLLEALEGGAAAAGPRLYWDRERRLLLPPPEERSRRDSLLRLLAGRSPGLARVARRRWRRHVRPLWEARQPVSTVALSGALLAVSRTAWERIGPFDEGYRLYFEETDWLHRLRAAGLDTRFVPAAEAVHLYDRSASREPRSRAWFEASRRRFRERNYGRAFTALLGALERLPGGGPAPEDAGAAAGGAPRLDLALRAGEGETVWVEVSPSQLGFPAAAERVAVDGGRLRWELPEEIWSRLDPGVYRLAVVGGASDERAVLLVRRPDGPPPHH